MSFKGVWGQFGFQWQQGSKKIMLHEQKSKMLAVSDQWSSPAFYSIVANNLLWRANQVGRQAKAFSYVVA